MERIQEVMWGIFKNNFALYLWKINPGSCAAVRDIEFVNRNLHKVWYEIEMIN